MERSHLPSRKAKTSAHAPVGEPPETPRTSEDRVVEEPPSRRSPCPLRWADPAAARVWLERTRSAVDDLAALAREGGRRTQEPRPCPRRAALADARHRARAPGALR